MKADLFIGSSQSARTAFVLLAGANAALVLLLLITIITLSGRETVVRIPPPMTDGLEVAIGQSWASDDYIESWAWWTAMVVGNVNSENVDDAIVMLNRLMTDRLQDRMREDLKASIETMRVQGFRMSFGPQRVFIHPNNGKVYVVGNLTETPVRGSAETKRYSYEMVWTIRFGLPRLTEIRGFEGNPPDVQRARR